MRAFVERELGDRVYVSSNRAIKQLESFCFAVKAESYCLDLLKVVRKDDKLRSKIA